MLSAFVILGALESVNSNSVAMESCLFTLWLICGIKRMPNQLSEVPFCTVPLKRDDSQLSSAVLRSVFLCMSSTWIYRCLFAVNMSIVCSDLIELHLLVLGICLIDIMNINCWRLFFAWSCLNRSKIEILRARASIVLKHWRVLDQFVWLFYLVKFRF